MDNLSNEKSHEKAMEAHQRFMARKTAYVMRNPSAVPVREREMILGDIQREELRRHEMDMLDKRNENALAVAKENRGAAREQGMEAAKVKAAADIKLGEINKGLRETELQNQLTMHEKTMANNLAVMEKKGLLDKELETIRVQGALNQAAIKNKHEADLANAKNANDLEVARIGGTATVAAARHKAEEAKALAKYRADQSEVRQTRAWVKSLNHKDSTATYKGKKWRDLSLEDKREYAESQGYDLDLIGM